MKNPQFFIENQSMESILMMNFHLKRVQIIIEHVKNGIAIAKANNLPDEL